MVVCGCSTTLSANAKTAGITIAARTAFFRAARPGSSKWRVTPIGSDRRRRPCGRDRGGPIRDLLEHAEQGRDVAPPVAEPPCVREDLGGAVGGGQRGVQLSSG